MDDERWNHVERCCNPRSTFRRTSMTPSCNACGGDDGWRRTSVAARRHERADGFLGARRLMSPHASSPESAATTAVRPAAIRCRSDALALSHRREARWRRHGRRLQGRRRAAASVRRAQVRLRRALARDPEALSRFRARSADGVGAEPPEHLHDLRHRRAGRPRVHRHGVSGRDDAEASDRRGSARASTGCSTWASRSPTRWTPRTRAGIVHRDIKPANIFIARATREDARFRPRQDASAGAARRSADVTTIDGTTAGCRMGTPPTCRRSKSAARPAITAPTSGASAWCSTKWPRGRGPSAGRPAARRGVAGIGAHRLEVPGDGSRTSLSTRRRPAHRSRTSRRAGPAQRWQQQPVLARRRVRWLSIGAAAVVVTAAVAGAIYSRRPAPLTDKDTIVLARLRQQDGRPGVRRHAPTRTRGAASAVAVPQPHLRRTHRKNAGDDAAVAGDEADSRDCSGCVRPNDKRRGARWIDRQHG